MSKKLEDNGRWESSRMMLPEHREQYLERHQQKPDEPTAPRTPSKEELQVIRDSVLLPMMLSIVEKNRREVEQSSYTLKPVYVAAANALMDRIHKELMAAKKSLREHSIKVFDDEQVDNVMYYKYVYRGYSDKFAMVRDVVRAEISTRIGKYAAELFKQ
jgi:hypothetical protein